MGYTTTLYMPHGYTATLYMPHGYITTSYMPHGYITTSYMPHGYITTSYMPHGTCCLPVTTLGVSYMGGCLEIELWQPPGLRLPFHFDSAYQNKFWTTFNIIRSGYNKYISNMYVRTHQGGFYKEVATTYRTWTIISYSV